MADFRKLQRGMMLASGIESGVLSAAEIIDNYLARKQKYKNDQDLARYKMWERLNGRSAGGDPRFALEEQKRADRIADAAEIDWYEWATDRGMGKADPDLWTKDSLGNEVPTYQVGVSGASPITKEQWNNLAKSKYFRSYYANVADQIASLPINMRQRYSDTFGRFIAVGNALASDKQMAVMIPQDELAVLKGIPSFISQTLNETAEGVESVRSARMESEAAREGMRRLSGNIAENLSRSIPVVRSNPFTQKLASKAFEPWVERGFQKGITSTIRKMSEEQFQTSLPEIHSVVRGNFELVPKKYLQEYKDYTGNMLEAGTF